MANKMPAWFNRECGGRVARADGGSVNRVSEDSKQKAAKLREEADADQRVSSGQMAKDMATAVIGTGIHALSRGRLGRAAGRVGQVLGGAGLAAEPLNIYGRQIKRREADSIERGEAEPGREDRKRGGKVKRGK